MVPVVKNPPASTGDVRVAGLIPGLRRSLGVENSMYKGGLQSMGLQRFRCKWAYIQNMQKAHIAHRAHLQKKKSNLKNGEGGSAEIFFQRRHRDVSTRYMKRCSVSLIVREMLIKASIIYHLTPVRMAIYKKRKDSKCMEGCGKENLCVLFWGM